MNAKLVVVVVLVLVAAVNIGLVQSTKSLNKAAKPIEKTNVRLTEAWEAERGRILEGEDKLENVASDAEQARDTLKTRRALSAPREIRKLESALAARKLKNAKLSAQLQQAQRDVAATRAEIRTL